MATHMLDDILSKLDRNQQRATYSAVAALVGEAPRSLMRDKPRSPNTSWVVSKSTGLPTGYKDTDVHPQLTANEKVLSSGEELAAWLKTV